MGKMRQRGFGQVASLMRTAFVRGVFAQAGCGNSATEAACRALEDFLHHCKEVPRKDAAVIAANAPVFVQNLATAAKENVAPGFSAFSQVDHRDVVDGYIKQFGLNEMEPFLESLGRKQCESEGGSWKCDVSFFPGLLSSTSFLESIGIQRGKLFRLLERDSQLVTNSVEALRSNVVCLQELGVEARNVAGLAEECPALLRVNLQQLLHKMLVFLDEAGIDRKVVGSLLKYNPQRVIGIRDGNFMENLDFLRCMGMSEEQVLKTVRGNPQVLVMSVELDMKPKLAFFKELGLTDLCINNILSCFPSMLGYSIQNNLLPKINYLMDLGVEKSFIITLLGRYPSVFGKSMKKTFARNMRFLESVGVKREDLGRVIQRCPAVLTFSINNNMAPKILFFQSIGLKRESIVSVITRYPALFECSIEDNMRPTVAFLQTMGLTGGKLVKVITWKPSVLSRAVNGSLQHVLNFLLRIGLPNGSAAMARAVATCVSLSIVTLESRLNRLVSLGFSNDAACEMIRKQPSLLALGEDNIRSKYAFIAQALNVAELEVGLVALLLTYSLEMRLKPRLTQLAWLKSRGLLTREYAISTVMNMSQGQFSDMFVNSYTEAETVFDKAGAG